MKIILAIFGALLLGIVGYVVFFDDSVEVVNYPPKNEKIVVFGDSLVEGVGATPGNDFVTLLGERLGRETVNLGVSGDTTKDGLLRTDEVLEEDPGIVVLLLGGNDFIQRFKEEETKANLKTLIERFQNNGSVVVLLGVRGGLIRDNRDQMYKALSKEYGLPYLEDVLEGLFTRPEFMHDGIHPNDRGYSIVADRLVALFRKYEL